MWSEGQKDGNGGATYNGDNCLVHRNPFPDSSIAVNCLRIKGLYLFDVS